jgi:predicted HTH domain antitoxin
MPTIPLDDELLAVLPGGYREPTEQVRELAILELYRRRVISSGKAAELLAMTREEFIRHASRLGIPYIDLDSIALERELESARRLDE